jgi:hypothetical protein
MARKGRVFHPSAPVVTAQFEVCFTALPGAGAGGGAPGSSAGNYLVFVDPEGLRVGGTAVRRPRPVPRVVGQHQNCPSPTWLPVHESFDALYVLHHVVGPDVLCPLAQQLVMLAVHLTRQAAVRYFSSSARCSPRSGRETSRSRRIPGSGLVSSRMRTDGSDRWIAHASACWKSASEWNTGRDPRSVPTHPVMLAHSPTTANLRPLRQTGPFRRSYLPPLVPGQKRQRCHNQAGAR